MNVRAIIRKNRFAISTWQRAFPLLIANCMLPAFCLCQNNFSLKVKVNELPYSKIYLASIYGHKQYIIDSAVINQEGVFQFTFQPHLLPPLQLERGLRGEAGLYRIILGQTPKAIFNNEAAQSFVVIFNNENTTLTTNFNFPVDSMQVWVGTENKMYYQYLKRKKQNNKKLDLLEQMLRLYPVQDNFYSQIQKQYNTLQNQSTKEVTHLIQKYPTMYFTKVVCVGQYPFLDASLTEEMRLKELKNNYFKPSDFRDTMLLYSNIISDKIFAYINIYRNANYTEAQQSDEFIQAANKLLAIAKTGHTKVFQYTLNYLMEGFNEIKQDAVLAYITDNYYSKNSCEIQDEKTKQIIQKTTDYKRTAIGAIAPEIIFPSPLSGVYPDKGGREGQGVRSKLSDIHSDYTLIVFYATWCPHCTQVLPEIKKVVDEFNQKRETPISNLKSQYSNLTTVFVSLDNEEKPWKDFIDKNELSGFINLCELKGWNGEIGKSYNVNATPTLFLLDKDKKIIAKPENAEQLINNMDTITK